MKIRRWFYKNIKEDNTTESAPVLAKPADEVEVHRKFGGCLTDSTSEINRTKTWVTRQQKRLGVQDRQELLALAFSYFYAKNCDKRRNTVLHCGLEVLTY